MRAPHLGGTGGFTMSKRKRIAPQQAMPMPVPSDAERIAIESATHRLRGRSPRLSIAIEQDAEGALCEIGPNHNDRAGWLARLEDAFGTRGTAFALSQLNQLIRACQGSDQQIDRTKLNGMLAVVEGAKPENEIQAMLAIQMAMVHAASLDVLRRAQRVDQIVQVDSAGNLAVKLMRTFAMQAETLAKLQRGGEQVVKVVHVHPGGQAIVGDVHNNTA
jgi:proteasome lid subunit RPN8/RPN11